MKSFPLRVKIALWSAVVVAVALLISGVATAWHFHHEDVEMLDHLLSHEVRGVFSELERLPADYDFTQGKLSRSLPATYKQRHVEIHHMGEVVYRKAGPEPELFGAPTLPPGNYSLGGKQKARLAISERGPWQVRVALETRDLRDSEQELIRGFLLAWPALLLVAGFGGWWIARQALSPISAVTRAAQEITAAHLEKRLPVPRSRDEVQTLSLVLNGMIERLERSFHQARRFSADTSHELRTPLTVVRVGLETMLSAPDLSPAQEQQLLDLLDTVTRLTNLIEKLLLLSRADAGHLEMDRGTFDLVPMLREAMEEAAIFAESSGVEITGQLPPRLELEGDSARLMQVWRNLLENAVKYNRPGGRVSVELKEKNGAVHLAITNTGLGLSPSQAERLFERFYRAASHRDMTGHGLGLSISREIVRAHRGDLILADFQPEHTEFVVTLPKAAGGRRSLA